MPDEAARPGDVYAQVDDKGNTHQITVYGWAREKMYDINPDYDYSGGQFPDGHIQRYDENGVCGLQRMLDFTRSRMQEGMCIF